MKIFDTYKKVFRLGFFALRLSIENRLEGTVSQRLAFALKEWVCIIEEIIKEKTSADHLLYVSLKYTKTCDVILNLLARWKSLIELSFDSLIEQKVESGKIPHTPESPKQRIEFMKKYFKKFDVIQDVIPLYIFFKRVPDLNKTREGEFRKNVNLKVIESTKTTEINMEKLGEYAEIVEKFISEVKKILAS